MMTVLTDSQQNYSTNTLSICIDARVELLSIILILSGYGQLYPGRISSTPSLYLESVTRFFNPYANHPVIHLFKRLNENISGDLPVAITLYHAAPPELGLRSPFDEMIQYRVKDTDSLVRYGQALRQFAIDTNFMDFFAALQAEYAALLSQPEESIRAGNCPDVLEAYFGWQLPGYYVIFAPLFETIAFGPRVYLPDGTLEPYCVFPYSSVEDGLVRFKTGRALLSRLLHEFGHSFVNPLVDQYQEDFSRFDTLMGNITYKTKANYGSEWLVNVYEHIVRAVTTRLTWVEFGAEDGAREMAAHQDQGFIYLPELCEKLIDYEQARQTYPTFREFFPELVGTFATLVAGTNADNMARGIL